MTAGVIRVGISGWTYEPWRGVFYPKGLRREDELAYAASQFRAIEVNGTFFAMQRPDIFAGWAAQVPADFAFAVKAPRHITHVLRLSEPRTPVANFIASGVLRLGVHLGPILWQFPANFRFDAKRIAPFLRMLPRDTGSAALLGRQHDNSLRAPPWLDVEFRRPLRHAFEVRHDSFRCREFIDLLAEHAVALVYSDSPGLPVSIDVTADFVYCRLRGAPRSDGYDHATLDVWARRAKVWAMGGEPADTERIGGKAPVRKRDVFIFFDNDPKVRAPANAAELIRRLRTSSVRT